MFGVVLERDRIDGACYDCDNDEQHCQTEEQWPDPISPPFHHHEVKARIIEGLFFLGMEHAPESDAEKEDLHGLEYQFPSEKYH